MNNSLKRFWDGWKKIAHKVGRFQTMVLLSVFYLLIVSPLGMVFKLFRWDPLEAGESKRRRKTNWKPIERKKNDLASIKRQS